eukprot:4115773-Pyramimonas_sp.AAC.1
MTEFCSRGGVHPSGAGPADGHCGRGQPRAAGRWRRPIGPPGMHRPRGGARAAAGVAGRSHQLFS